MASNIPSSSKISIEELDLLEKQHLRRIEQTAEDSARLFKHLRSLTTARSGSPSNPNLEAECADLRAQLTAERSTTAALQEEIKDQAEQLEAQRSETERVSAELDLARLERAELQAQYDRDREGWAKFKKWWSEKVNAKGSGSKGKKATLTEQDHITLRNAGLALPAHGATAGATPAGDGQATPRQQQTGVIAEQQTGVISEITPGTPADGGPTRNRVEEWLEQMAPAKEHDEPMNLGRLLRGRGEQVVAGQDRPPLAQISPSQREVIDLLDQEPSATKKVAHDESNPFNARKRRRASFEDADVTPSPTPVRPRESKHRGNHTLPPRRDLVSHAEQARSRRADSDAIANGLRQGEGRAISRTAKPSQHDDSLASSLVSRTSTHVKYESDDEGYRGVARKRTQTKTRPRISAGPSAAQPPSDNPADTSLPEMDREEILRRRKAEMEDLKRNPYKYRGGGRYAAEVSRANADGLRTSRANMELIPELNGGVAYEHVDVIRDRQTRKRMHAYNCPCCKDYWDLVGAPIGTPAPGWRRATSDTHHHPSSSSRPLSGRTTSAARSPINSGREPVQQRNGNAAQAAAGSTSDAAKARRRKSDYSKAVVVSDDSDSEVQMSDPVHARSRSGGEALSFSRPSNTTAPRLLPPPQRDEADEEEEEREQERLAEERRQRAGRHRAWGRPAATPEGYWEIGFPDTPRQDAINESAQRQRERQVWQMERDKRYRKRT